MKSPSTKLAVAATVVVACVIGLLIWINTGSSIVLADVLVRMEETGAYAYEASITGMGLEKEEMKASILISREYGMRILIRDASSGALTTEAYMLTKERAAIVIEHDEKSYMRLDFDDKLAEMVRKQIPDAREMLARIQNCGYTRLGVSTIDGVDVEGFRTTDSDYPDGEASGADVTIWVDTKTGLPVRLEEDIQRNDGTRIHRLTCDFQWGVPVDPAQFRPVVPDDYTSAAGGPVQLPAMSEQTAVRGLQLCLELRGQYPRALGLAALESYRADLPELKGLKKEEAQAYAKDPRNLKRISEAMMPILGLGLFHEMLVQEQRDLVYYGDTVTPEFPHAVLMRWRLDDGRYRVIFGDLAVRDVSLEELAELEAAPLNLQPFAIRPQPPDGTVGCSLTDLELRWTPGLGALEHRIYFGETPDSLSLAATTAEPNCSGLPALQRGASYYWRVDEILADGSVAPGEVWSLDTGRLVAWWRFDDAAGQRLTDASGNGYDGRIQGNLVRTDGAAGGALQFDGDGDYVDIGTHPEFDITSQVTVAAWFRIRAFDKESQAIITKGDTAWRLQKNRGTHSITFGCFGLSMADSWGATRGRTKVDDDRWHHAVGVYDGTRISLYVDGKLDASDAASGQIGTNEAPVLIGENSQRPNRFWHGLIDEVRIYSYALSEPEIVTLYQEESAPNSADCLADED